MWACPCWFFAETFVNNASCWEVRVELINCNPRLHPAEFPVVFRQTSMPGVKILRQRHVFLETVSRVEYSSHAGHRGSRSNFRTISTLLRRSRDEVHSTSCSWRRRSAAGKQTVVPLPGAVNKNLFHEIETCRPRSDLSQKIICSFVCVRS